MQPLDIAILLFAGIGIFVGYKKGFFNQIASILGLLIGFYVAKLYSPLVAGELSPLVFESMTVAQTISFIVIWLLVPLVFSFVASVLSKLLDVMYLGWINRLIGAFIGFIKLLFIASIVICLLDFMDPDNRIITETKKHESVLYRPVKSMTEFLFFVIKDAYSNKL